VPAQLAGRRQTVYTIKCICCLFGSLCSSVCDLETRAEGGERGAVAARVRLGHIPAGSTDAVAYSLNGTRAQETAALHIALGDRRVCNIHNSAPACLRLMGCTAACQRKLTITASCAVRLHRKNPASVAAYNNLKRALFAGRTWT
jgi:hypothetical protein